MVLAAAAVVVVLAVAFVACDGPEARLLPPPSSTSSTDSTSPATEPDYSRVALAPVPGQTTTTAPRTTGSSTVRGVVVGPDGAVPGATVRIDRLVGDAVQRTDLATDGNGGFIATGLPGGRFRVRAFVPPELAMVDAEVFYLPDGGDRELRLTVEAHTGYAVAAATTPARPILGDGVNLAVRVARRAVDADGVVQEVATPNVPVRVRSTGWTELEDEPVGITDADGVVVFEYRCDRVSSVTASAVVGEEQELVSLEVPPCAPLPTTTTVDDGDDDDGDGGEDGEDDDGDGDGDGDGDTTTTRP